MLLKVAVTGDGRLLAGDAARLRKGLLDGKLAVRPGDNSESVMEERLLAEARSAGCLGERFRRAMSYQGLETGEVDFDLIHVYGEAVLCEDR